MAHDENTLLLNNRPWVLRIRSSNTFITTAVCFAVFTDTFLYALIVPILPETLSKRAHVAPDQIQNWTSFLLGAYGVGHLVTSPLIGYLADRLPSRQLPMLVGLGTMTAATLMYCLGASPLVLLIARALQGFSAAIIWVVGMALLIDTIGADDAGAAIGWTGIAACVGYALGPLIGGAVYDLGGHYTVFAVAFGVLGVDFALRLAVVERKDLEKCFSSTSTPNGATYGATDSEALLSHPAGEDRGRAGSIPQDAQPNDHRASGSSGDCSPAAPEVPSSSRFPTMIQLLLKARILTALWATLVTAFMIASLETVLPLYTQRFFAWSPTLSGATLAVFLIPALIDPYIGSLSASHTRRGVLATSGFLLGSLTFFGLTTVVEPLTAIREAMLWALMGILGFGYVLGATPTMMDIGSVVEADESNCPGIYGPGGGVAMGYGLYNVASAGGSLLGSLVAGWVIQSIDWAGLCIVLGSIYAGTAVPVGLWCGGWIGAKVKRSSRD